MKKILLFFIVLFLGSVSLETFAQTNGVQVLCCGNSAKDTARFKRKVWIDSLVIMRYYANSDADKFLTVNQYGELVMAAVPGGASAVTSVNGEVGAVVLTTSDIAEGVNMYFTNVRADARIAAALINYYTKGQVDSVAALIPTNNNQLTNGAGYITRASLSAVSPLTYNVITGAFEMPAATSSVSGYISSTDWQTFNGKQAALNGTGLVRMDGATVSYDNTTYYPSSNPNSWIGLGAISALAPLVWNSTTGQMSIPQASGSVDGFMSSADWNTFNNKQPGGTYIQYILSGFAISATGTTTVTLGVDSVLVATRLRVQKAVDSLNAVIAAMMPQLTTAANYTGTLTPTSTSANANSTVKYHITAQAGNLVLNPPTGSWADGQVLVIRITNNGSAYTLTFSSASGGYRFSTTPGAPAQPAAMTASKTDYLQFVWNALASKFDFVGYGPGN